MAQKVHAVVVDPADPHRLALKPVKLLPPRSDEAAQSGIGDVACRLLERSY